MWRRFSCLAILIAGTVAAGALAPAVCAEATTTIVCPASASFAEKLAAKEIRRYFYLRTGRLAEIAETLHGNDLVLIGTKDSPPVVT